jgi:DNA replication and repair protein RecF
MYFKEVNLHQFRNYGEQSVSFDKNVNVFVGENAQGKTNLLEGLYVMGLGKSFRTSRDSDMIGFGKEFARVATVVCDEQETDSEKEIEIVFKKEGKIIRVRGLKLDRSAELLDEVYIVVFSPEDLRIIKEGPEHRRRFLDRELCQYKPVYYNTLGQYRRVLRHRNALLRACGADGALLGTYDEALADYGMRVVRERQVFVRRLEEISAEIHSAITEGSEQLSIRYDGDFVSAKDRKETLDKDQIIHLLHKNREKDERRGYTEAGPHRDDLTIFINGTDSRQFGSQGQQRTAALAMRLAEIRLIEEETGKKAILLLDDVLSELDEKRQTYLIEAMRDVQVFITSTGIDEDLLQRLPSGSLFRIDGGLVNKLT